MFVAGDGSGHRASVFAQPNHQAFAKKVDVGQTLSFKNAQAKYVGMFNFIVCE
jgi:hypothetical protein